MTDKKLVSIEESWLLWKDCLGGPDKNSIINQIMSMVWDVGIFKLILESRQLWINQNPIKPKINNTFHSFIDRNYFQALASSIRKISDNGYSVSGKRGVFSLLSLISDIKKHKNEITRTKFFELRGIEYDIETLKEKESNFIREKILNSTMAISIPPEITPERSIDAHKLFDNFSVVNFRNRSPYDQINTEFLEKLENKVNSSKKISGYVDKFIAHASSPESRKLDKYESSTILIIQCWEVQKEICEVTDILASFLLGVKFMFLPLESPNYFEHMDIPLVESCNINNLRSSFEKYRNETEQWKFD